MANNSNILDEEQNINQQRQGGMNSNAVNSSPSFNPNQNQYRNNQNQNKNNFQTAKKQIKKTVLKEGVKKVAQAYGVPEAATERILETRQGKEILDAATDSDSPTTTALKVTKVATKQIFMMTLPAVILPLLLILIIAGVFMGKFSVSGLGESNGGVYDELRQEIEKVSSKYRPKARIDGDLIFATLVSYKGDEEYSTDGSTFKNMSYMKRQVDKLASYQIITTTSCYNDSSTIRQIAKNDDLFGDTNYNCVPGMDIVTYKLSTEYGNYNDDTSGSAYYWNLIDEDFIFNYYNEYMVNQEQNTSENEDKINEIIDYIYSFYELMDKNTYDNTPLCSDGITVDGITMEFEDYVKGVVYAKIGDSDMPLEAIKAIAVSVRSSALSSSNSCTRELHSSTSNQIYKDGYESNPNISQAVKETSGQYLVHNGEIFNATYNSFPDIGSSCNVVCDNNYCSADLSYDYDGKLGTHTVRVPRFINDVDVANDGVGSCSGMNEYAIWEDALNGATYEEILEKHYSSNVETIYPATEGLVNEDGFLKRVERANRDNLYYYSDTTDYSNGYIAGGLEGECAWYAVKRTNEIIATMGLQDTYNYVYGGGNGRDFCYAGDYQQFEKSTNPNDPTLKAGAIISWYDNTYGHVAVVEAVYRDNDGNITSIDVSEAGIGFGQYGRMARLVINSSINPTLKRQQNCEGNGSGCQHFKNISIENIKNLYGQQQFICYLKIIK